MISPWCARPRCQECETDFACIGDEECRLLRPEKSGFTWLEKDHGCLSWVALPAVCVYASLMAVLTASMTRRVCRHEAPRIPLPMLYLKP